MDNELCRLLEGAVLANGCEFRPLRRRLVHTAEQPKRDSLNRRHDQGIWVCRASGLLQRQRTVLDGKTFVNVPFFLPY